MRAFPDCGEGFRRLSFVAAFLSIIPGIAVLVAIYSNLIYTAKDEISKAPLVPLVMVGVVIALGAYLAMLIVRILGWVWQGFTDRY